MAMSQIYVRDVEMENNRPLMVFAENQFGSTPASVPVHHVLSFPVSKTITIAQGATCALCSEHECGSESLVNGVIVAYVENAAPPEYIDLFFKMRDDAGSMKDMVFAIGRISLLDAPFDNDTDRVYTALAFSLPYFEAVGQSIAPFASIGAKLPAAWAPATALEIKLSILGLPNVLAP